MKTLIFWREWNKTPRILYTLLLVVFLGALSWCMYHYTKGTDNVFGWTTNQKLDVIPVKLSTYTKGIFNIPIEGVSYVVKESFQTVTKTLNTPTRFVYGSFILLAMCVLLTVISSLQRLWYFAGMAIFMFFLSKFGFGYLGDSFGDSLFLIICIALYGLTSYYFQSFGKYLGLLPRLFSFIAITVGLGVWISVSSTVNFPVMYLSTFSWIIPLALTFVFITIIGHDIIYGFFHLIAKYNPGNKTNSIHFGIISFIYLGNLVLIFLKDRGNIDFDILYIDLYWLLVVSAVLGIWGYRRRGVTISKFISFNPQGGLLYLALGIIAFATIGYYQAIGNDAINSVIRDVILFSHIGYGVGYVVYVYVNLGVYMGQQVDLTKVAYQGQFMPHPMLRLVGLVFIFGFYSASKQIQREQMLAGYHSVAASTYWAHGNKRLTMEHYKLATQYFFYTHQPHYALANLKIDGSTELVEAITHLQHAIISKPTEHAYSRLAEIYTKEEQYIDAVFTLREGVKVFPGSMQLNNNLGLAYSQTEVGDSAIYYFEKADSLAKGSLIPKNNLMAYLAFKKAEQFDPKKLQNGEDKQDLATKSNHIALYNLYQTSYQQPLDEQLKTNPRLNGEKFAYLYNYLLNRSGKRDNKAIDSVLAKETRKIESNKDNRDYAYYLQYVRACFQYYGGNISHGINSLASIPATKSNGYYNAVLGLWLLEQGAYEPAISYLKTAKKLQNTQAAIYLGIALSEKGDIKGAIENWKEALARQAEKKGRHRKNDSVALSLAQKVMGAFTDTVALNTDEEKFILLHYRHKYLNEQNLKDTYSAIQDPNYKTWAAADLMNYYLDQEKVAEAEEIYKTLKVRKLDNYIKAEINHAYLRLLKAQEKNDLLLQFVDQLELGTLHRNKKPYFMGIAWYNIGDHKKAEEYFKQAVNAAPFSEEVILTVTDFYLNAKKDIDKAYKIVTNAVRRNPFSAPLYKSYALRALEMGLDGYGDTALESIQDLTDKVEFERFKKKYLAYKTALEEKRVSVK
ncbi:MFS transporter [Microscilla marina]|uniref:Tetratricopeptide repeat domain protein n=1 Tax=Microscilla marina ATCC 23134 TaxID=313606 RepID=A1ZXZ4_MICM2|nr:MFS transporter [Microscilla marina]EAY24731.1 tetratricopeptide repeat domain protein [Microscilla marina ATCC 23134]